MNLNVKLFYVIASMSLAFYLCIALVRTRDDLRVQQEITYKQSQLIGIQESYIGDLQGDLLTKHVKIVTVTAYSGSENETDSDPGHTAIMIHPEIGTVAVSQDLIDEGWTFGKSVYLAGIGIYRIGDLMSENATQAVDIYMGKDPKQAKAFGRCIVKGILYD